MTEDYDNAISRVDDLIAALHSNSICYVVQRDHTVNITTDIYSRHINIFSLGTCT